MELIQTSLKVGKISKHGETSYAYRVSSLKELETVIIHLDKYPLITQKLADYILFKKAVMLIKEKEHLTKSGLHKLAAIKASLNLGLSETLKAAFPDVISASKPLIESTAIKDFNWLTGFIDAEGCFIVVVQKASGSGAKTGFWVSLKFTISQHSRDKALLESFVDYLGCGHYYPTSNRNEGCYTVSIFSDIHDKIIPILEQHPLVGSKRQDLADFVKVANLIKSKDHLTPDGLVKIKLIKSGMNTGREL